MFHSWLRRWFVGNSRTGHGRRQQRFRPSVEALEARCTPTATVHAAVWLDGQPTGGGQGILTSLAHAFGPNSFKIITNAQLDTPGFLKASGFNVLIVSRFDSSFGGSVDAAGAANIKAFVGTANSPNQGGVAIFTNDASDNFFGSTSGDPFDPNLDRLFTNSVQFAANTGHGYIGEFNGAVMAMTSNTSEFLALGLLKGSASATHGTTPPFVYLVGPIGGNNAIDNGVKFPFTDTDRSTFRTDITGGLANNIVDVYQDNGSPAVMANQAVISGGGQQLNISHTVFWPNRPNHRRPSTSVLGWVILTNNGDDIVGDYTVSFSLPGVTMLPVGATRAIKAIGFKDGTPFITLSGGLKHGQSVAIYVRFTYPPFLSLDAIRKKLHLDFSLGDVE